MQHGDRTAGDEAEPEALKAAAQQRLAAAQSVLDLGSRSRLRGQGARFLVTAPMNASIRAAIAAISEDAWTAIKYPRAICDDQLGAWTSDAEVAEIQYTAFASKKSQAVTARLVGRRVRLARREARVVRGST
jgi:hypothetical protein